MRKILIVTLLSLVGLGWTMATIAQDNGPNIEVKAIKKVPPTYPALAKVKRIQGKVIVALQVNAEGIVSSAEFKEGNVLFKPASLEASKQWVFQKSPDGMAGYIVLNFELKQ